MNKSDRLWCLISNDFEHQGRFLLRFISSPFEFWAMFGNTTKASTLDLLRPRLTKTFYESLTNHQVQNHSAVSSTATVTDRPCSR